MVMKFASFRDVIDLWPSRVEMAEDVFRARRNKRRKRPLIRVWYCRDAIPAWWLDAVVTAAAERGFDGVTYAMLAALHKARHPKET